VGEDVGLGVDAERTAGGGAKRRPMVYAIIAHPGRWDPGCSRVPRRGRGPRSNIGRSGGRGVSPQQAGERVVVAEAEVRSGAAPELAGLKRAAPEQGSSGRVVKKARVRSKM
jgi:hypothetical protein